MRHEDTIFLAAESIPFGRVISVTHALVARDDLGTRIAASAVMFGALAGVAWIALGWVAAL